MLSMILVWLQFIFLAALIGFAGIRLSTYADKISDRTGLSRNWIGVILLATVTSLPELISGVAAVRIGETNLAMGDILGSCQFNLLLVFILDLFHRHESVYSKATRGHLLTGALGMILISYVGFSLLVTRHLTWFTIGHVGGFAALIPIIYVVSMRMLYNFEMENRSTVFSSTKENAAENDQVWLHFGLAALTVVAAGSFLPSTAEKLAHVMNWNSAFVGTIFLALATSLPEIAVTIGAIRIGAMNLALSNVLGSNLFNIVILTIDDLFYTDGPLFKSVSNTHIVTAFSAVMMTGLVLVALIQPPQKRVLNTVSGLSLLLLAIYLLNAYIAFFMGQ